MDKQNKPVFCLNLPCQGSENVSLDTAGMQLDNWDALHLTSPRLLTQATKLDEVFKLTSLGSPYRLNSQIFSSESGGESSSVAAATPSCVEFEDGKEESSYYFQEFECLAPFAEFKSSVMEGNCSLSNEQDFGACNGLFNEKMRLDSSATCQKRFIMFDQTGSRGRIIFHPSQFSMMLPNSTIYKAQINPNSMVSEEIKKLAVPVEGKYSDWETLSTPYNETLLVSAFAALQKIREDRFNSLSPVNFGTEFIHYSAEGEESTGRLSYDGASQAKNGSSHSQFHEDTEDLEALLCSDDEESSTGHSPSEVIGNNGHLSLEEDNSDVTSGIPAKRRRIDFMANGEQAVDYTPAPASFEDFDNISMTNEIYPLVRSPDISVVDTSSWDIVNQPKFSADIYDDNYSQNLLCGYSCHSIHREYSSKGSGNEQMQSVKCLLGHSGSAKNSRKGKIKRTVKLLKSILPGGDCMDTAIVLDEAIQYVRLLQQKVKKLEANQG